MWPQILGAVAGPLIGGLIGGSGGGGSQAGTTQTIQSQDPWSGQQPYLKRLYQSAMGTPGQDVWTPTPGFGNDRNTYMPASGGFGASGYDGWDGGGGYGGAYGQPAGTWSKRPQQGGLQEQQYFPGSTVVPQSPETLQALDLQSQRALSGSPLQSMGNQQLGGTLQGQYLGAQPGANYLQDTAQGKYLYGGEGFNNAFNAARNRITPMVQGAFESAGRFGGGLGQEAETGALADAFAGLYGQERGRQQMAQSQLSGLAAIQFNAERQRQLASMGFIPQMAGMDFQNIGALSNVGQQREQFGAQQMADQVDRWNFAQQAPYNLLNAQAGIVQGMNPGGTTTTTQPYFQNRAAGALGGALAGASIANNLDFSGMFGGGGNAGNQTLDQTRSMWGI